MKFLAGLLNTCLFLFTLIVIATDGLPKQIGYLLLTLLVVVTPILSLVIIFLKRVSDAPSSITNETNPLTKLDKIAGSRNRKKVVNALAVLLNLALLVYVCWALFQPHPAEEGYIPYVILVMLTPIVNLFIFLRTGSLRPKTI